MSDALQEVDLPTADRTMTTSAAGTLSDISEVIGTPPPRLMQTLLYSVTGLMAALLLWSYFGRYNVVISTRGVLVPAEPTGLIQVDSLARVTQLLHHDGDQVKAGEPVVALQRVGDGPELLTAPIPGTLSGLSNDQVGALVQPGQQLAQVVPDCPLEARVQIANQDRGRVKLGEMVRVKVDTFPYQEYGVLDGRLASIAELPAQGQPGAPAGMEAGMAPGYDARIELDPNDPDLKALQAEHRLRPGLALSGDIVVQQRRILNMLLEKLGR